MTSPLCPDRRLPTVMALARAGVGVLLLTAPGPVATALTGRPPDRPIRRVARVLGARQLAQCWASGFRPSHPVLALGVQVDAVHAASMMVAAALWPRYRRAALIDAAAAGGFAAAGLAACRMTWRRPPTATGTGFGRRRDRCADRAARLTVPGYRSARRDHSAAANVLTNEGIHP